MELFRLGKQFPKEEMYSLTDQMRRSSRSVAGGISEAWRRRRYVAAFVNKLNEAEAEAAETQTWIGFALNCEYMDQETAIRMKSAYDEILRMLVSMQQNADLWTRDLATAKK